MKKLLTLSLILNVVLIYFYFEEINQSPIERIVMEKKGAPEGSETPSGPQDNPATAALVKKQDAPKISDRDVQIIVQDEQSFIQASDEIGIAQNKFLEDLEISEGFLKRKEKLTQEYFKQTGSIYGKNGQRPAELSFKERRRLIELEEKVQRDYKNLFGESRWDQYKKWVDDYNKNVIKNHKSTEFSPLLMSY